MGLWLSCSWNILGVVCCISLFECDIDRKLDPSQDREEEMESFVESYSHSGSVLGTVGRP